MIGSVIEWLTPVPRREDVTKNARSWTLSGPVDVVEQGYPVPVIYGEVLTDGYTISAGIAASQLNPAGSVAAAVLIGGEFSQGLRVPTSSPTGTAVFNLSAGPLNIDEPYVYTWSIATPPAGVRLLNANQATCTVEVDFSGNTVFSIAVNVRLDGRSNGTSGAEASTNVFATNSQTINLVVEVVETA